MRRYFVVAEVVLYGSEQRSEEEIVLSCAPCLFSTLQTPFVI